MYFSKLKLVIVSENDFIEKCVLKAVVPGNSSADVKTVKSCKETELSVDVAVLVSVLEVSSAEDPEEDPVSVGSSVVSINPGRASLMLDTSSERMVTCSGSASE